MDYQKITATLFPDNQEMRDILMAGLGEIGFESFVEQDDVIEAFVPVNIEIDEQINSLDFSPFFEFTYKKELITDRNWNKEWEQNYFQPLLIANKCLIRAPFHTNYPKSDFEIIIEPNMAFGTGNHETTSLMIEHILELDLKEKAVLDMGCGTGILAILASMRGASSVTAIDIDQWAYDATVENSQINNSPNIQAYMGDATLLENQQFDLILANIHKNVLINDIDKYNSVLKNNGMLIMSGFYEHDLFDIEQKANANGLLIDTKKSKNRWMAVSFNKITSK